MRRARKASVPQAAEEVDLLPSSVRASAKPPPLRPPSSAKAASSSGPSRHIILPAFWSLLTGSVTLKWSAGNLNSLSDYLDTLSLSLSPNPAAANHPTMTDVIHFSMERMTEELDDLEHRGLFTRSEITAIVKRRRDFEFRLKRPSSLKQDYLDYINYKHHLEDLCKQNRGYTLEKDENEKNWRKSILNITRFMRILDTYVMAVMWYKEDMKIWVPVSRIM